jgi:hypothetical protein
MLGHDRQSKRRADRHEMVDLRRALLQHSASGPCWRKEGRDQKHAQSFACGPGDRRNAGLQNFISILMDRVLLYPMRYMATLRQTGGRPGSSTLRGRITSCIHIRAGNHNNHEISQRSTGRSRLLNLVNAFEDATQTTHTTPVILFKRSTLHAVEIEQTDDHPVFLLRRGSLPRT